MACPLQRLRLAASLGLGALAAAGQPAPTSPPVDSATPPALARQVQTPAAPATAPAPAATDKPRIVSPEIAAALAATMPIYDPKAAPQTSPSPAGSIESDPVAQPKNGIVRLPSYLVREWRLPEFSERELYTEKGLKELALKRYVTEFDQVLNWFSIPLFSGYSTAPDKGNGAEKRAMRLFEQDEDIKRAALIQDMISLEQIH